MQCWYLFICLILSVVFIYIARNFHSRCTRNENLRRFPGPEKGVDLWRRFLELMCHEPYDRCVGFFVKSHFACSHLRCVKGSIVTSSMLFCRRVSEQSADQSQPTQQDSRHHELQHYIRVVRSRIEFCMQEQSVIVLIHSILNPLTPTVAIEVQTGLSCYL